MPVGEEDDARGVTWQQRAARGVERGADRRFSALQAVDRLGTLLERNERRGIGDRHDRAGEGQDSEVLGLQLRVERRDALRRRGKRRRGDAVRGVDEIDDRQTVGRAMRDRLRQRQCEKREHQRTHARLHALLARIEVRTRARHRPPYVREENRYRQQPEWITECQHQTVTLRCHVYHSAASSTSAMATSHIQRPADAAGAELLSASARDEWRTLELAREPALMAIASWPDGRSAR